MSQDVKAIARGTGLLLPATLAGSLLLLLLDQYVNGVLGNADYGLFNAIKRVLQLVGFVVLLGMENAVIRFVATAPTPEDARRAVRHALVGTLAASGAATAVLIALAGPFAVWVDPAPATADALRIGALSLPFAAVRMVAVSASQGWKVVTHRALVMYLAWPVAQFLGIAALAHGLGLGIRGVMIAYVGAMALGAAMAVAFVLRVRPAGPAAGSGSGSGSGSGTGAAATVGFVALLAFAWPMWVQTIVMGLYTWVDQVLLASLRSTTEAGIYGPVATLAPLFGVGLGALNGMFAPIIAERRLAGDMQGLQALYRTVTRWAVALAMPPLVVCAVLPGAVLGLWPNGSPEAIDALRITCAAQLLCTGVGSVNYLLIMAGHQRATLLNGIPAMALNLALSYALIPTLGVTGAAIANAIATMTANGVGLWQVRMALGIHPFDRAFLRPLVAGLPCAAVAWAVGAWVDAPPLVTVAIAGIGGGVVFLAALRALGLDADDRVVVDAIVAKVRRRAA
ncbi:MAG: polysaccharide biosynthesis C-terminal domain-containing protein [Pseudomonadota bacterium]|nr:polysaccharide biosynthesis C-terminal domain-containing protein [Pseudomonadota bacterium]